MRSATIIPTRRPSIRRIRRRFCVSPLACFRKRSRVGHEALSQAAPAFRDTGAGLSLFLAMNAALPTGRRGQVLALALTLLVGALLWIAIVNPLTGLYAQRAETLQQR